VVVSDFDLCHHSLTKPHRYGLRYQEANVRWRVKWGISRFSSPLGLRLQLAALRLRRRLGDLRRAIRP